MVKGCKFGTSVIGERERLGLMVWCVFFFVGWGMLKVVSVGEVRCSLDFSALRRERWGINMKKVCARGTFLT